MKLQIKMLNFVYIQGASINKWCIARFIWNTKVSNTYFSDESPCFSTLLKSAKELALLKLELQINRANVHKNILLYCKSLIIGILAIHLNFSWKIPIIQVNKCSVMNLKNSIISGFFSAFHAMAVALGHYCKVHANWEDLNQGFSCIFHLSQLWKKFGLDQVKVNWKLGPWLVNQASQPIICLEPDHVNLFWKHNSIGNQEERDLWLVDLSSQPIREAWFQIDLGMFPIRLCFQNKCKITCSGL